jgi:aminocarboxymuconate-semialdehyde decarboxylase
MMKIDMFSHFLPKKYFEALRKKAGGQVHMWSGGNGALSEIDVRLRVMDMYPDVTQILTVATPPLETLVTASDAIELARIANDEMAEVVAKYPNRFITAVACLPLNDIDASIKEADRTITQLHFKGVQIFSNINGEPLDSPKFMPLYERMAQHDLPIWIHPWLRATSLAGDLLTNAARGVDWPFETSVAMGSLAQSGVFEDYPNIKFITHHCGGMVPFFARRIARPGWERGVEKVTGKTVTSEQRTRVMTNYRKFYADTAVYGNSSALMCGYAYFGADHLLFGTDMPLGGGESSGGYRCTLETIRSIEQMDVPVMDKDKIFEGNAVRLLRLEP